MENVRMWDAGGGRRQPRLESIGPIIHKTTPYQLLPTDSGQTFTNKGSIGPVTFTLPTLANSKEGMHYRILKSTSAQNIVVAANGNTFVGYLTPFTGTTALTHSTISERGSVLLIFDGTSWVVTAQNGTWTIS